MHVDANKVRTPFDIYLDSVYVHTGDFVEPGDTLYSYYMLDMLVDNANPNEEPAMIAVGRNYTLQHTIAVQEIEVMKVRIEELRKQILAEDHNISFGLSDNSHKLDLQRQLREAEAKLRALQGELDALRRSQPEARVLYGGNSRFRNDSTLVPRGEEYFCAFAGRRDGKSFAYSEQDLIDVYRNNLKSVSRIPKALSGAMGDLCFICTFKTQEEMSEFFADAIK